MKLNQCSLNVVGLNTVYLNGTGTPSARKGSDRSSLPAYLKDALVSVIDTYGMNNSMIQSGSVLLKDKTGNGNDFIARNLAGTGRSGFGGWNENFDSWVKSKLYVTTTQDAFTQTHVATSVAIYKQGSNLTFKSKIKVTGLAEGIERGEISTGLRIYNSTDGMSNNNIIIQKDGVYNIDYIANTASGTVYFYVAGKSSTWTQLTTPVKVEQISDYPHSLCTDGKDDRIESIKPVMEMIGSDATTVTAISMVTLLSPPSVEATKCYANYLGVSFPSVSGYNFIDRNSIGKTGIFGVTVKSSGEPKSMIFSPILGDKIDYTTASTGSINTNKFSVHGILSNTESIFYYPYSIAYNFTILIKNRIPTEDDVNLIIAYHNLDHPSEVVKPQIYYDVKKQDITNENHTSFNDKLLDFSGNGFDADFKNFGWALGSGIGKWGTNFRTWGYTSGGVVTRTMTKAKRRENTTNAYVVYTSPTTPAGEIDIPSFAVNVDFDVAMLYYYYREDGGRTSMRLNKGINTLPKSYNSKHGEDKGLVGFYIPSENTFGIVEQIPDYPGAAVTDAIDDNITVTGLPLIKDYTSVANRAVFSSNQYQAVASKGLATGNGAFITDANTNEILSFGSTTRKKINKGKSISYQTKYSYNGEVITSGNGIDTNTLCLGMIRNGMGYIGMAIWQYLLYPYSLSPFLLERQLKHYKAGTIYPETKK